MLAVLIIYLINKLFRKNEHKDDFLELKEEFKIDGISHKKVKIIDQFSYIFNNVIEKNSTTRAICGYVVCTVADYLVHELQYKVNISNINDVLKTLGEPNKFVELIEKPMKFIKEHRENYLREHANEFDKESYDTYLHDMVANYEISDYIRNFCEKDNIFYLRYCSYDFPDLHSKTYHEELERVTEEEPFKTQRQFVEVFYPNRELISIDQFINDKIAEKLLQKNRPIIIIGDMLGHYVTFLVFQINIRDAIDKYIFLIDSTEGDYMHWEEPVKNIRKMCFSISQW